MEKPGAAGARNGPGEKSPGCVFGLSVPGEAQRLEDRVQAPPQITMKDAQRAWNEWGCNCGPVAIAAALGKSLDEVRPHMGDFESKRYTNPTLMWATLRSLGVYFSFSGGHLGTECWPSFGLARIQWEGPWTKPNVPARARYRHTHWVGVNGRDRRNIGIFDVNALGNGSGWCHVADWKSVIVPWILKECVPKADGKWHITHAVEIDQ
jgi:hypothetical protein